MKVFGLGEFGLIYLLNKKIGSAKNKRVLSWQQLVIGTGDDSAVWQDNTSTILATVDSLIQDVHFSLDSTYLEDLGWKAVAANLGDIAAIHGSCLGGGLARCEVAAHLLSKVRRSPFPEIRL